MHAPPRRWRGLLALATALLLLAPVAVGPSPAGAQATPCVTAASADWPITRLAGSDRFATAACVARTGYPGGADTVLLARGDAAGGFADALAGTVLARVQDAPVLLTGPAQLAPPTRDAIAALAPDRVLVLGGPVAVSDAVVGQVGQLVPDVQRVAGDTREGTAAAIAEQVPGDAAFVVNGHRPADALTAGAAAARAGAALLLVGTDEVPEPTRAALAGRSSATIVGGTAVVGPGAERGIRDLVGAGVARLGGSTRFETAATVARTHPGDEVQHLVSGADRNLVDAIAAGWFAAMPGGGPVVYTLPDGMERATDRYLRLGPLVGAPETRMFGGPDALAPSVVDALEERYEEATRGGPPDQLRGMWVHLFDDSLKTRAGIERVLDTAAEANLNSVIVQGARRHDAYYDSDVLPATTDPALEPGLDVLDTLIPAAHARGLQVHVWWSVMPTTHPTMPDASLPDGHINLEHGAGTADSWMQTGWTEGYEFLDPAIPGVQRHVVDMVTEVVARYDVDGVHLDYLRYECLQATGSDGACVSDPTPGSDATANQHPIAMDRFADHGDGDSLADFMRRQTEDLMRRVMLEVSAIDPSVVVSGALIAQGEGPTGQDLRYGFESTKAFWNKGQDWVRWVDNGLLDHALPMAYFREADADQSRWYDQWAALADVLDEPDHVTALGQAAYLNCVPASLSQLGQSASTLDGAMVYSYQGDTAGDACGEQPGDLFRALSAPGGLFSTPAAPPDVPRRTPAASVGHVLVSATDGETVEVVPLEGTGTVTRVRADATGHAGFVDLSPGRYLVASDSVDAEVEVQAGRVTRVE